MNHAPALSALERRCILTLAYSQIFTHPLSAKEVWLRLISDGVRKSVEKALPSAARLRSGDSSVVVSQAAVIAALTALIEKKVLIKKNDLYALSLDIEPEIFTTRKRRKHNSLTVRRDISLLLKSLRKIPWITAVGLTGATAMQNNDTPYDDLDCIVLTQPRRLWLARLCLLCIAIIRGKKSLLRQFKDTWCFNVWLTPEAFSLPPQRHSLYIAYEVCQIEWLWQREQCEAGQRLVLPTVQLNQSNLWVQEFLPHYMSQKLSQRGIVSDRQKWQQNAPLSWYFDWADRMLYWAESSYLSWRTTVRRKQMQPTAAFLHATAQLPVTIEKQWQETYVRTLKKYYSITSIREDS